MRDLACFGVAAGSGQGQGEDVEEGFGQALGAAGDGLSAAVLDEAFQQARWAKWAPIPRKVYVRPANDAKHDPFSRVPVYPPRAEGTDA
ncbi:hypothetical protein EES45_34595 [Streptomyces sp. ADI97-07]|nr:hypothetical protein ASD51_31355 [Streptomyces sp. Root55]RPK71533.1 hypothetical protein EES45_34595 [Streptomyces sp. ADI97-07]